ncbi:hypothetical protein R5W23_001869 [Gemmata sp. JC673]|uniref:DUF3995 domain-containing protein n=1 Tax=Gemmata algarum TaxID=2975278 RepID=A0ABU5F414_9BACT|nr:hypothetical protein [Gemmata algarum]MDY3560624.1 hypothetical protein [Gemmata algarum]
MSKRLGWVGLAALSVAAGYGVYDTMQSFYPLRSSQEALPGWSVADRVAAGVGVTALFGCISLGLARLVRSQPQAERGLVVAAWAGWVVAGTVFALGYSGVEAVRTMNDSGTRTFTSWIVGRGLVAGLVWSGVVLAGVFAWRHRRGTPRTPNQSLQPTGAA